MNQITENLLDDIVHAVSAKLSSAGIELNADLLSDLNENISDFFIDECDIEINETLTFSKLSKTQKAIWKDLAKEEKLTPAALFKQLQGMIPLDNKLSFENHFPFSLIDETTSKLGDITGHIDNTDQLGLAIHFQGYGDHSSKEEHGTPIYIEKYQGNLRALIYSDINVEQPTHIISFEKARLQNRHSPIQYEREIQ